MYELDIKKRILFRNDDFIAVLKYSGESYHNDNKEEVGFFNNVKAALGINLYSVHRLDKDTSGIMLFALNLNAHKQLLDLFSQRQIYKVYLALSDKKPKKKQGIIKGDLESTRGGSYKLTFGMSNPSITRFKSFKKEDIYFFLFRPKTGRTHQLRVVAKSLGSSILGDSRYGGTSAKRMYLHCYQMKFSWNDEVINIKSDPSEVDFLIFKDYFNEELK